MVLASVWFLVPGSWRLLRLFCVFGSFWFADVGWFGVVGLAVVAFVVIWFVFCRVCVLGLVVSIT